MAKLFFVYLMIVLLGCREKDKMSYLTGKEGKQLPSFEILLADSTTYFNTGNLQKNKKIILFYYSPTCPYCRAQTRDMLRNIELFKDGQLCMLTNGDFKEMKDFITYFQLEKYPSIILGLDTGRSVIRNYHLDGVPFTAVFDKDHRLQGAYLGIISHKKLFNAMNIKKY